MNPERISSMDQIVARTPEDKKALDDYFGDAFSLQWEDIKAEEIKKTPEQIKIIEFVNEETNKMMEKYGVKIFDIDKDKIHIVNKGLAEEIMHGKSQYAFNPHGQFIISEEEAETKLSFANKMLHEMIHFKSFQNGFVKEDYAGAGPEENHPAVGQIGISLNTKLLENTKFEETFMNLNEAMTEELTKRVHFDLLKNYADFSDEALLIDKIVKRDREDGNNVNEDELISICVKNSDQEGVDICYEFRGYAEQRKILNQLIDKIYNKNKDRFKDREEVFDVFARSYFTGNMVSEGSCGRLIEDTFGAGTFKKLAESDYKLDELDKLKEFADNLN